MRDLLYFDFEKAASIASQLAGGLRERLSTTEDTGKDTGAGVKFGIPGLADAKLGADYAEKRSTFESRVLHHDLLNDVEAGLQKLALVSDLTTTLPEDSSFPDSIREVIENRPYLRAAGPSAIEDYRRVLSVAGKFNEIAAFIKECTLDSVKKSEEYLVLQEQLANAKQQIAQIKDRNQKAQAKLGLRTVEEQISSKLKAQLEGVPDWLIKGLKLWIETFMPNRINFRIYPFRDCPSFQVICNLKRGSFVDQDLEHLLYGYGNLPNVPLAVFGLITSLPPKKADDFDPMREFEVDSDLPDRVAFESGLRAVFSGMDGLESFVRFSRYPNVTVHPIAVYRDFGTSGNVG